MRPGPSPGRAVGQRGARLPVLVWDNHGCMPLRPDASFLPQLARYRASGVDVVSLNVGFADMSAMEHLSVLSFMRAWLASRPDEYVLVRNVTDIERARRARKLAICFDVEGMSPVVDEPWLVQTFYELGVRWMSVAYNRNNKAGGGCLDEDQGLSPVGRAVIDEMERVGMVLCLSHAGPRTAAEALEYARNPPIFSHSNSHQLTSHPRNVADELLVRCAARGGIVGVNGIGSFLGGNDSVVPRLLAHIRHLVDLIGPRHIGLGLDYVFDLAELGGFISQSPQLFAPGPGLANRRAVGPEDIPVIADALSAEGLADEDVAGILGGNWLRLATEVWK